MSQDARPGVKQSWRGLRCLPYLATGRVATRVLLVLQVFALTACTSVSSRSLEHGRLASATATPYDGPLSARRGLATLERATLRVGDGRAAFLTTYLLTTDALRARLGRGYFEDDAFVSTAITAFANYYRRALHSYEYDWVARTPRIWQRAHAAARIGRHEPHRLLLLGITAHLRDLAYVVADLYDESVSARQYRDFERIGHAVLAALDPSQRRLGARLTPSFTVVDILGLGFDEAVAGRWILAQRRQAWCLGRALARARSPCARAEARARIEAYFLACSHAVVRAPLSTLLRL